jgi:hypothetical protein
LDTGSLCYRTAVPVNEAFGMVDSNFLPSLASVVQELQIQNHTRSLHLLRLIHSEFRVRGRVHW